MWLLDRGAFNIRYLKFKENQIPTGRAIFYNKYERANVI